VQTAVETCLVEPYPLRLDLIKLCGARYDMDTDKDGIHFMHTGTLKDSKDAGFAILEILDGKNLEPKDRCGNAIHLQGCPKHSIKEMADDQTKGNVEIQRERQKEKREEKRRG
jgi:hypothetical protein